jgi:hypothetical protein
MVRTSDQPVYTVRVGPESAGYLANDPPVGNYSPNTFVFRLDQQTMHEMRAM